MRAILDSGCTKSIIKPEVALGMGLAKVKLRSPITFVQMDGSEMKGGLCKYRTEQILLRVGDHWEAIQFIIAPTARYKLVLGLDWLKRHNPMVKWREGDISFTDPACKDHLRDLKASERGGADEGCNTLTLCPPEGGGRGGSEDPEQMAGSAESKNNTHTATGEHEGGREDPKQMAQGAAQEGGPKSNTNTSTGEQEGGREDPEQMAGSTAQVGGPKRNTNTSTGEQEGGRDDPEHMAGRPAHPLVGGGDTLTSQTLGDEAGCPRIPAEYADLAEVFDDKESDKLPPHRDTDCAIEILPNSPMPKQRTYPMTPKERVALKEFLDKNLARGFIRPSMSPLGAPVFFREKKDHSLRLVTDYRHLNAISATQSYPLPLIKDMLAQLSTGKIFTKLDLKEAFHRVRIRAGDEYKTAINTVYGKYEFLVLNFGLKSGSAVFQNLINEVLREHLGKGVLCYSDDVLIISNDLESHVPLVRQVLKKLLANQLYVKLPKCAFHQDKLDYLGYRISSQGIEMDPSKVQALLGWESPGTRRHLQSFLGFANFYRQFIPNFAQVALPLTDMLKTKKKGGGGQSDAKPKPSTKLPWNREAQEAFEMLKSLMSSEPILKHPDTQQPFVIQVDASDAATGAVLLQKDDKGILRPCSYLSRKFNTTESHWPIWEKEAAAVKFALEAWRHLLEGAPHKFVVYTDHRNLEALQTPRKMTPKQLRWAKFFARFDFELKYLPGKENFLADALSRLPQYHADKQHTMGTIFSNTQLGMGVVTRSRAKKEGTGPEATPPPEKDIRDPWLREHYQELEHKDGVWLKGSRTYIPEDQRKLVLHDHHDNKTAGHFGFVKTLHLVRRKYWWPFMRKDVKAYVHQCPVCATVKGGGGKPSGLLRPLETPAAPWEHISMDFIVDLPPSNGKTVIWVVVDLFSKQAHFIPCRSMPNAEQLAQLFIEHCYKHHGAPSKVISDRGSVFVSRFWKAFLRQLGAKQDLSTAYHPQTDGQTERVNQVLEQYLRCYTNYQQDNWSKFLAYAQVAYNNSVHSSTGHSPFEIVYGRNLRTLPTPEVIQSDPVPFAEWMAKIKDAWPGS
uniref:Gypsy retrotransposon integrase-like protein 1 n=1 Tax=Anolis carolinensis TaxID=28377 RepID=A0A803TQ72_ANOCA